MFSYYGGKSKIIKHYPKPLFQTIIEPFAGSARYALEFGQDKEVWLNDKYDVIYKIWKYLVNATPEQINSLPNLKKGDDLRNFNLSEEERYLLGFSVGNGRAVPSHTVTSFGDKTSYPKEDSRWRPNSTWTLTKNRILKNLQLIKNWKITNLDYREMENVKGTYFIDPPYENGGNLYVENKINFQELANWCKTRKGQIIVCENTKASWLPFRPLIEMRGQKHTTIEAIYTK